MSTSETALYPLESLQSALEELPQIKALGLRCLEFERGRCLFELAYSEQLTGNIETGVVHGGVITTLLDSAGGAVAFTIIPQGRSVATLDLRIDYLSQAQPNSSIKGFAECYKQTQNVAFVRGYAYQSSKDDPIASFSASFMIGSVGFAPDAK